LNFLFSIHVIKKQVKHNRKLHNGNSLS
jgi:hypothetical protein